MREYTREQVKATAKEYFDFYQGQEQEIIFELNEVLKTTPMLTDIESFWLEVRKEARVLLGHIKPRRKKEPSIYDECNWFTLPDGRIICKFSQNPHQLENHGFWETDRHQNMGIADIHTEAIQAEKEYWEFMDAVTLALALR